MIAVHFARTKLETPMWLPRGFDDGIASLLARKANVRWHPGKLQCVSARLYEAEAMKNKSRMYNAIPVQSELVSPGRFIGLMKSHKTNIAEATIVAPRLGKSGFGGVLVKYKSPVYRAG